MKNISPLVKLALIASALWVAVPSMFATAYVWTNKSNAYWTNAAAWNPNGVPTNGDSASLPAFINANVAITLDGGDRNLSGTLDLKGSGNAYNNSLVVNLDSGAALRAAFELYRSFQVVISNGTFIGTGENRVGGQQTGGSVILDGGNLWITNGAGLFIQQGLSDDSKLQINSGAFTFRDTTVGYKLTVGNFVGSGNHAGRALMNVAGGTADVSGLGNEMIILFAGTGRVGTGIVNVTSGTLTTFTNGTGGRIVVGGRSGGAANPGSWYSTNLAQLNVSGSGVVNAGGYGAFVGRNTESSPGEFNVNGGEANMGGLIVGDWGKLSQTSGVLRFTARQSFLNEATNNLQHLFMSGGTTYFQGIASNRMTINMGGANAGNVLGQGFYNVQFGSNGGSAFRIDLSSIFYGSGDATGGNHVFGDGIKDLVIWTNTSINYNSVLYSGTSGANSLMDFATLATPWGWDVSVGAIPEPGVVGLVALGGLLAGLARSRRRA